MGCGSPRPRQLPPAVCGAPPAPRAPSPAPRAGSQPGVPGALPRQPRAPRGRRLSARPNAQPRLGQRAPGLCGWGRFFACQWGSLVNPRASAAEEEEEEEEGGGRSQLGVNEVGKESFREACKQPPPWATTPVPNPTWIDLNPGDKCFKLISLNKNEAKQNSLKSY